MKPSIRVLIAVVLLAAMLAPRLADLTAFTAADEPFWLAVGANFYYALTHREFENTVYEYHPAVTTMWIVTAAMLAYFPEYRGLMNGYFQQEKTAFDTYLVDYGKEPLALLWWSRFIQVLINAALWVLAFVLVRRMLGEWPALAVLLLASFAPYLFGQSRMLNHETMVGLFTLDSILAMAAYLQGGRKTILLVVSALAAALANLTKSSSIVLVLVMAVVVASWHLFAVRSEVRLRPRLLSAAAPYLLWLVLTVGFYVLIWPGMWVAPGKMLGEVYGNAFSYAFQGARLSITQELEPSSFSLEAAGTGVRGFLTSITWRTSPITWLGLLLAARWLFVRREPGMPAGGKWLVAMLILEAAASITLFGVIRGRNSPHYVLAAYVCLEVAAALGWAYAITWLGSRVPALRRTTVAAGSMVLLVALQAAGLLSTGPYYYTYYNPLLRLTTGNRFPLFFYGERMEQAAAYLASKEGSRDQTALVYFGRSFSYYYPGETLLFKPVFFQDRQQLLSNLARSDYLVMYTGQHDRLPLLDELVPEHVLYLNDREYVEIYNLAEQPEWKAQ